MALTFPAPAQIKNLQDPTDPQDAATKAYADTLKVDPTKLSNGTSNLAITTINGNVTTSVGGIDNVLTVTTTGTVVKGSENVSGNLTSAGNLLVGLPGSSVYLGNVSNVRVYGGTTGQFLKLTNAAASTTVSVQTQTTDTTVTVTSTTGFPTSGYIIIENEVIAYTGVTATTFTGCTRGQLNSVAAAHATTAIVYSYNGGTLGWSSLDATQIINGTSNVAVSTLNGNVTASVAGNANIVVVTGTGANIKGYANINPGTITASTPVSVVQTWNNASAVFTGIYENITDTASNSTSKLIDLQVGGVSKFVVDKAGNLIAGTGTGGTLTGISGLVLNTVTVTGAQSGNANVSSITANLGLRTVASTYTDTASAASATVANAAIHAIDTPTLAATSTGVTFTNASTLYIANAPIAGTNATLTNKYALFVANGNSYFNNVIVSGATTGTAPFNIASTTKVANLYANASDFSNMTVATTGTYYPTFVSSSAAGLQQKYTNSAFSVNAASGTFLANNVNVSSQLISTVATGTAPIVVNSTTKVANLYANVSDFSTMTVATTGTYYPTFVSATSAGAQQEYVVSGISLNAATSNLAASILYASGQLISGVATGTAPLQVNSTTRVPNLNVAYANVSDFNTVTTQTTGTFYPVFVNGSTSANYALSSNSVLSFDAAAGQLNATKLNATDLTLTGNLLVSGTTTTINTSSIKVVDPIIELGGGVNGTALTTNDSKDRGLLLHYAKGTGSGLPYVLSLNGSTQSVTTPANANFALPGDFTIEAYVNPTDFTKASVLFSQGAGTSPFSFGIHTDGKPYISFGILNTTLNVTEATATTLTAPTGAVFTSVLLASWGSLASGTMPNFIKGTTTSATSQSGTETTFVGKNTATIAGSGYNAIFGDPTVGTPKYYNAVLSYGLFSTTALTAGTWSHIAVTRIGSTVTMYVNGVASGSTTYAASIGSSTITNNTFGASYQSAGVNTLYYNGLLSNLRLIKGQGIYTGTFTTGYTNLTTTSVGSTGSVVGSIIGTVAVLSFQSATITDYSTTPIALTAVGAPTMQLVPSSGLNLIDAFIGWDNGNSEFAFGSNVSVTSEVITYNSFGNVRADSYLGNYSILNPGTVTANTPPIQVSQTWNNSSVAFTGVYTNFTDTASASTSKLIDLQKNNASMFNVDKNGNVYAGGTINISGSLSTPSIATTITSSSQPYITSVGSLTSLVVSNATGIVNFTNTSNVSLGAVSNVHITGGTSGYVLTTDGSGGLSWQTPVSSFYIGSTLISTSRAGDPQLLTGVSIAGSAGSLATPRNINGVPFNGTADITVPLSGAVTATTITASGISSFTGIHEVVSSPTLGTYNIANGTVFYHSAVSGAFAVTITNLPAVTNGLSRTTVVTIMISQGATIAYPTTMTVNGTTVTPKWQVGAGTISGTINGIDIYSYNIVTIGGSVAAVTGTWSSYA
jgi:hypothetical protein